MSQFVNKTRESTYTDAANAVETVAHAPFAHSSKCKLWLMKTRKQATRIDYWTFGSNLIYLTYLILIIIRIIRNLFFVVLAERRIINELCKCVNNMMSFKWVLIATFCICNILCVWHFNVGCHCDLYNYADSLNPLYWLCVYWHVYCCRQYFSISGSAWFNRSKCSRSVQPYLHKYALIRRRFDRADIYENVLSVLNVGEADLRRMINICCRSIVINMLWWVESSSSKLVSL